MPTTVKLKETVIIENKPPAIKDTLDYKVKDLIQPGDKKIEDVLKKIPGVEIDEKGKIKHNGKIISRVLIDGDDLKGNNYQKITKTLPAQSVDTIQVIDKYSDNPLLTKIQSTDEKVLNLKLNAKARNVWTGEYSISAGIDAHYAPRYKVKIEEMLLRKKFKTILSAKTNNIGDTDNLNLEKTADFFFSGNYLSLLNPNSSYDMSPTTAILNFPNYSTISNFNTPISNFNQSYNLEQAYLFKLPKKWEFKSTASLITGKNQMFQEYTQGFILPNSDTIQNTQRHSLTYKPLNTDVSTYLSKLKSRHLFRWINGLSYTEKFHHEEILFNGRPYTQHLRTFRKTLFENTEYTYQITKKQAIRLITLYQTEFDFTQHYNLYRNQFVPILQDTGYAHIQQTIEQPHQNAKLNAIYNTNHKKYYFTATIGAEHEKQRIKTAFFTDYSTFFDTLNRLGVPTTQRYYAYIEHKYNHENYSLNLTTEAGYLNFTYNQKTLQMPYFLPKISVQYNKRPFMTSLNYERKLDISPFQSVFDGYILQNFQGGTFGLGQFNISPSHSFTFINFFNTNQSKFKWNTILMYNLMQRPILYENLISTVANQNQMAFVSKDKSNTMLMINTNVSQYFKQITSALRGTYSLHQFRYFNYVNNVERQNITYSHFYSVSLRSGFKVFNYHAQVQQNHTYSVANNIATSNTNRQYNQTTHVFLDLSYTLSLKFRAGISSEYLMIRGQKLNMPYFLNVFAEYQKNHFSLGVKVNNLLNNQQFRQINFTDFNYTIQNQRLMSRYVQIEISYFMGY